MIYVSGICKSCEWANWDGLKDCRVCSKGVIDKADAIISRNTTKHGGHTVAIVKYCEEFLRYPGAEYPYE